MLFLDFSNARRPERVASLLLMLVARSTVKALPEAQHFAKGVRLRRLGFTFDGIGTDSRINDGDEDDHE